MKTLYLHIGTPKTATTAIQNFCWDNRELLEKKGFCFPLFDYRYRNVQHFRNGHFLIGVVKDADGQRDIKQEKKNWQEGLDMVYRLFAKYDKIILSDESIWNYGIRQEADFWKRIAAEAQEHAFEIRVIVYFRRQDEFLYSWWNQQIKEGGNNVSVYDWESMVEKRPFIQLDYYKCLEQIAGYVGKQNIVVRRFSKKQFYGGSIYADFLNALGLEFTDEYQIGITIRNVSLTKNNVEIKKILNKMSEVDSDSNTVFRKILTDCSVENERDRASGIFSTEETAAFMAEYEEENDRLAREYLGEETRMFEMDYTTPGKWSIDSPDMTVDLVRWFGMTTVYLLNENKKLKKDYKKMERRIDYLENIIQHPVKAVGRKTRKFFKGKPADEKK